MNMEKNLTPISCTCILRIGDTVIKPGETPVQRSIVSQEDIDAINLKITVGKEKWYKIEK